MPSFHPSPLLRYALLGDAAASGATGLLMFAGAGVLTARLGLPEDLLRYAGLFLLPYAAAVAWLGLREAMPRSAVWTVIAVNAIWAADSLLLLLAGSVTPTGLGVAFVTLQAAVVAAFAAAQCIGLHREPLRMAAASG